MYSSARKIMLHLFFSLIIKIFKPIFIYIILYQVKQISDDVNSKTVDCIMAGVASVVGEFSTLQLREKLRQLDAKYIKTWLIREDAVDLMTLKYEEISIDEHYARLYGPRILVHENRINEMLATNDDDSEDSTNFDFERGKSFQSHPSKSSQKSQTSSYIERKQLQQAFSSSPYERYKNKSYREDSEEHIIDEIQRQRNMRTRAIWSTALAKAKAGTNDVDQNEAEGFGQDNRTRPKSAFTFGDAADQLLQARGPQPRLRRGQSTHGDGQRLRQVYRDAFLHPRKSDQERHGNIDVVITESDIPEEDENKCIVNDASNEKDR